MSAASEEAIGCAGAVVFMCGLLVGWAVGCWISVDSMQREAVKQGVARWEMVSQDDPEVTFKWNEAAPSPEKQDD